ncbi:hypothetical protein SAMN05216378_4271 [Paenibacillus catalpae]|uniref:Uncharacterized protein n=1 Tax=Paenibacillus catalpae TaxID=1045775 RepID=A0A1I2DTH8_9BACL|nr:hypothetical protein [Paenibacillus catalpae]SFE83826.1 hypothetical protein SAMN05216378_4271 [Paenibacillus catalpae]
MAGYLMFSEVWTPFKMVGFRLFKDENGAYWYKYRNNKRSRLFR